ncbi:MAG: Tfp pilus assembly protein PilO [Candidatus Poriferisodalaceae bacterium]|jgi:Tfp pilus assembly protein PilO
MNRKVLLIGIGALFVCVIAWMLLLWRPAGTELDGARVEQTTAENDQGLFRAQHARLKAIEADVPRLQSGIETLRSAVPDDPALAEFLLALNEAGAASGVHISSVTSQSPRIDEGLGLEVVKVSLASTGGYYQMLDFFNRLQDMHRIMAIESVGVNATRPPDDPSATPTMQIVIGANIYSAGLDSQLSAALAEEAIAAANPPEDGSADSSANPDDPTPAPDEVPS